MSKIIAYIVVFDDARTVDNVILTHTKCQLLRNIIDIYQSDNVRIIKIDAYTKSGKLYPQELYIDQNYNIGVRGVYKCSK